MSTADQTLSSALHGEALDHLAEQAQGRDDIRTEDLIAAGLLMLAGHVDLDDDVVRRQLRLRLG